MGDKQVKTGMVRVVILAETWVGALRVKVGDVVDVTEADGSHLVLHGKAKGTAVQANGEVPRGGAESAEGK